MEKAFGHAAGLSGEAWWVACQHLFKEVPRLVLQEVEDPEDNYFWVGDGSDIILVVNFLESKRDLRHAFGEFLKRRHPGKPGRKKLDMYCDWPLDGTPNVQAITLALDVHERALAKRHLSNWQIAQALKINPVRSDGVPSAHDKKILNAQISRYKSHAERLIRGVERGEFPPKNSRVTTVPP